MSVGAGVVQPQLVRHTVVGHEHVDTTVLVEVRAGYAQPVAERRAESRALGTVRERAVAVVPVESVRGRVVDRGTAIGSHAVLRGSRRPTQVVDDKQVEIVVPIEVQERGRRPPPGIADARRLRHVLEPATAVVAQEDVRPPVGDVEIHIAAVIVVAGRHPHPVAAVGRISRLRSHCETTRTVVQVEFVCRRVLAADQASPLHQVGIEIAVAVDIRQRHAAGHDFRRPIATFGTGHMPKVEAPGSGFFAKPNRRVVLRCIRAAKHERTQRGDEGVRPEPARHLGRRSSRDCRSSRRRP